MAEKDMLAALQTLLEPINQKLDSMKSDIDVMKSDIRGLQANYEGMQSDIRGMRAELEETKQYERETRILIESKVIPQIQIVAEQHGDIVKRLKMLENRYVSDRQLHSHMNTLDDVVRSHTLRIEALEAKIS